MTADRAKPLSAAVTVEETSRYQARHYRIGGALLVSLNHPAGGTVEFTPDLATVEIRGRTVTEVRVQGRQVLAGGVPTDAVYTKVYAPSAHMPYWLARLVYTITEELAAGGRLILAEPAGEGAATGDRVMVSREALRALWECYLTWMHRIGTFEPTPEQQTRGIVSLLTGEDVRLMEDACTRIDPHEDEIGVALGRTWQWKIAPDETYPRVRPVSPSTEADHGDGLLGEHLLEFPALTGQRRNPTAATQWCVVSSDGQRHIYGDQSWIKHGGAVRDEHPDGRVEYRAVQISYGEWCQP